jgi:hypothetical protein
LSAPSHARRIRSFLIAHAGAVLLMFTAATLIGEHVGQEADEAATARVIDPASVSGLDSRSLLEPVYSGNVSTTLDPVPPWAAGTDPRPPWRER